MPKLLLLVRLLCALPLLLIGVQHLTGTAPLKPILDGAAIPVPKLVGLIVPWVEVLAGALLLIGFLPRLAGLMAAGVMAGALLTHLRYDWDEEPPIALPIAVLACGLLVAALGAGAWPMGGAKSGRNSPPR